MQTAMKFKTFIWPNNPTQCSVSQKRLTAQHQYLDGTLCTQEFGNAPRVFTAEGAFFGANAYASFLALQAIFRAGGSGTLVHPQWGSLTVWFTALEATQEPKENYVRYRATFLEG